MAKTQSAKQATKKGKASNAKPATIVTSKISDTQKADTQSLRARIDTWGTAYNTVKKDGHDIAARTVVHAVRYGDVTLATRFLNKMGKDGKSFARANMFKAWFEKHGPFRWDKESDGFKLKPEKRDEQAKMVADDKSTAKFLGMLMKQVPWDKAPEPEYKGFEFIKQLRSLISRGQKAEKEHGNDPKTDLTGMEEARALLAKLAENAGNDDDDTDTDTIEDHANVA